ncbi:hypothetical protein AX14_011432 [Amanita brunnescens Koide BX004]|nr:hypothetical protein AX14_011432 [Amanita brunnescens Koide BX004]
MIVSIPNGDGDARIKLTRVLYTPTLGFTLISIGLIDDAGYYSTFGGGMCEIQSSVRQTIGIIRKSGGVYHVAAAAVGIKRMTLRELHEQMGHISLHAIKDLIRRGIIDAIVLTNTSKDFQCQPCITAKMTKKPVPKIREGERANTFGEEIHSDLWGPTTTATLGTGGLRYAY